MKLPTLKGFLIGFSLALIAPAMAATVTTLYLSGGTPGTSGHVPSFTSDGLGLQDSGVIAGQNCVLSWTTGQNLSTNAIPICGPFGATATVSGIVCNPEVLVGGTATIQVWKAPSGTALGSGTRLDTTACNANTGAFTNQTQGVASSSISVGDRIGIVAAGAGWSSSVGSGLVRVGVTGNP